VLDAGRAPAVPATGRRRGRAARHPCREGARSGAAWCRRRRRDLGGGPQPPGQYPPPPLKQAGGRGRIGYECARGHRHGKPGRTGNRRAAAQDAAAGPVSSLALKTAA